MILLYLQTEAVRTKSREVALGRSMRDWMERMGLSVGGETARGLREQAARISACTLKFFWEDDRHEGWTRGGIVTSGLRFKIPEGDNQASLWEDRVVLDETFYAALRDHPVPLLEAAIRQLRDRSMSLDIYVWLAWRCHQLGKLTPISWPAIHAQFGAGFKAIKHFKPSFVEALSAATAAYPEARVEVGESGVMLHPARPPLATAGAMLIGYARVSTDDQNLDLQRDALRAAGCQRIYEDRMSGAKAARPGLAQAMEMARAKDVLTVWRLDRLGRSLHDLIVLTRTLDDAGIGLISLQGKIDTSSSGGKLIFHMFGALAEFQRNLALLVDPGRTFRRACPGPEGWPSQNTRSGQTATRCPTL